VYTAGRMCSSRKGGGIETFFPFDVQAKKEKDGTAGR
jgi:hypothetical protein